MKIPLAVSAINEELIIYRNGLEQRIPHPIKPFVLAQKDQFPDVEGPIEKWIKVPEYEEREYYRCSFANLEDYTEFRKKSIDRQKYILVNSFIEQLYISQPDFLLAYPHTNDLKIMFFDIEVASKGDGFFPKPISNEILCIGYSIWKYTNEGLKKKCVHKIIKGFNVNGAKFGQTTDGDKKILLEFIDDIKEEDPDIIAGYNTQSFDFPYLMDRCKLLDIEMKGIGRHFKAPYFVEEELRIPGRIHFDLYNSNAGVFKDQTLFGIKSRTLKEIARFYKAKRTVYKNGEWVEEVMDDIEVTEHIENLLDLFKTDPDRLYAYQDDDIYRTECVGHVYLRNCITLAEMLGVPLNSIVGMYSSFVPKLFLARNMEKKRLICTDSNFQRYNSSNGSIAQLGTKFEGALVGLYKNGYFPQVYKLDFSSMYPSSIQTWNLGPDTTSFVEKLPYTGRYTFKVDGKYNWYRIPDANFNCDLLVKVRNDVEGVLKAEIGRLRNERVKIKKQLKSATESEKPALDSQQYAIKVILNSIYGLLGLKSSSYGDMISAIMVTAMCRWTTGNVIRKYRDNLVELDSVTEDTPIYVYNTETKEIDIIPIEDLHQTNNKRAKYNGKYLVLTRNGWKNIKYTKKHKVNKNIHRVKISDGYVDVTEDHSLFNSKKKEITPKDIIPKKSVIETVKKNPESNACLIYGGTVSDPDFCWLIGFLTAEGSVYEGYTKSGKEKRQVSFNGNNIELMKKVEKLANEHFAWLKIEGLPKKPHTFKLHNTLKSSAVYKVQGGYNKDICDFLKEICYTKNRKDKKVPTFILNGTKEMKEAFLNGLMTGDGYSTVSKDNRKITSLDSKFKSLAAGVRYLWNSLDIKTICNIRKDKLNITTYRKRVKRKKFKKINTNLVSQNNVISNEEIVYDISTEDGTFVTALGNIVLHNTDGLILDQEVSEEETNKWLDGLVEERFGITDNYMQMEMEDFGRAYFYAMKNYVVEENGKYIIHGSSFKASRAAHIVDRAVNLAIQHVFNGKPKDEVLFEALNFKGLALEDFEERVKLSKEPREYDDAYDMRLFLGKQMEMKTGQVATMGTQLNYVVTKKRLPFPELAPYYKVDGKSYTFVKWVDSVEELDLNHYKDLVLKALDRFGIKENLQLNLFGDDFDSKPTTSKELDKVPTDPLESGT